MVAVRKLVTQPQAHGEVRPEFDRILYKPGSHPNPERNRRRGLRHLEQRRCTLQEGGQRGEVELPVRSAQVGTLEPFQPASQGNRVDSLRNAESVLICEYVVYVELVVSCVWSGTGRSNGRTALGAANIDLPHRFSGDERL